MQTYPYAKPHPAALTRGRPSRAFVVSSQLCGIRDFPRCIPARTPPPLRLRLRSGGSQVCNFARCLHSLEEKASGKISWRKRKIASILEDLNKGDNLVVSELSRLARSMLECMEILSIATHKGIDVYAIKGEWQLGSSIQSKIIAMAFSMAAEIERDLISKRTKEALKAGKDQGVKLGRPRGPGKSKLDKFRPEIEALLSNGSTQKFIARRYGTTSANLHNWLKKRVINVPKVAKI